jgi:pimeloyl-ACP methyl ester carboxylesterase
MAVFTFSNRGHDLVSRIPRGSKSLRGGAAHEVFTDCADDIQGAVSFAKKTGVREIYLVGHSTGCQKSVYWAYKKGRGVRGIILLAPISDYSATVMLDGKEKIGRALRYAKRLLARGKKHELLPENVWHWNLLADAQRFVRLYSGSGPEEIFTYWKERYVPKVLEKMRIPTLVLLAEKDEYGDRPAKRIGEWFTRHLRSRKSGVIIIPNAPHSFKGGERAVARHIRRWIQAL